MMLATRTAKRLGCLALSAMVAGCAHAPPPAPVEPPPPRVLPVTILSNATEGTPDELFARGESAVAEHAFRRAIDAFETLIAAEPSAPRTPTVLLDLGTAYEGAGQADEAQALYHRLASQFPEGAAARTALARATAIHALAEDRPALKATADALLARHDLDDVDRMTALGARGISEVLAGDLDRAARDIENGLDIMERTHFGALNRLPVPAAALRFAEGELRKARSEKITLGLQAGKADLTFLVAIESRCALLMSAQRAYADAIRSVDPHWAAMSGYRVGEMYRALHAELMAIPPVDAAKTERQKQLHFGMMHLRYRVLLEKGVEMMRRTLELSSQLAASSSWLRRAEGAKADMEAALEDEKARLAALPFTEAELQAALDRLEAKATHTASASPKRPSEEASP